MKKPRLLAGAIVTGAVAITSLFAAAPASAATLPLGAKISVVNWYDAQYYEASPVDAAITPVGTPTWLGAYENVEAIDVDDDGKGYALTVTQGVIEGEDCDNEDPECEPTFDTFFPDGATLYVADAAAPRRFDTSRARI